MVEDTKIEIELLERELRRLEATRTGRRIVALQRALAAKRAVVGDGVGTRPYEGLRTLDATRRLLREKRRPMGTSEIERCLRERGVTTSSKKYSATIYSTLSNSPDFVRIGKGKKGLWALAEWEDQQRAA